MTSNLGSEYILENHENANEMVMNELRHTFKPEFLNRIDEIIMFKSLSKDVVYEVLDKIIKEIEMRLSDKKITLKLTENAKKYIIDHSYDENYGARPIKRYVTRNLETVLASAIIEDEIKFGSQVTVDVKDDQFILE